MTDIPLTPEEADDALAAEYVLGVLGLAERGAAEARIRREPPFADRVAAWESRLSGLNDGFAEAPAPKLLPAIEARLFPVQARAARNWFAWLAGAGVAAALVLAALVAVPPPGAALLATLATNDRSLAYEARARGGTITITRVSGAPAPAGQVHEVWVIAPGAAPVSLGLLQDRPLTVDYPVPPKGWVLAVSVEAAGGSTTGAPTGPVILTAEIGADDA